MLGLLGWVPIVFRVSRESSVLFFNVGVGPPFFWGGLAEFGFVLLCCGAMYLFWGGLAGPSAPPRETRL